ncbi:MAG: lysophospholipid acyltransferase family protein [Fidelibacterota bacterium]
MLYHLIRLIAVVSLDRFFRRIVVAHRGRVAHDGATILVANHPNTLMDALVVGYAAGRKVHILTKSTLFSSRVGRWFLTKMGVVPVYRRQDDPTQMDRNEEIFGKLYDLLEHRGSLLIFPEGISEPGRKLQKIRTGTARIALGVEARNKFSLDVRIIPVGLNYSDIQRFRSDVYCRFGKPIRPLDYREAYENDPVQAVRALTGEVRSGLEKVLAVVDEGDPEAVIDSLETIYKQELMMDLGLDTQSKTDDFMVTKGIIAAVRWFFRRDPDRVRKMETQMKTYLHNLERLKLKDEFLKPTRRGIGFGKRLKAWLFLVLGFPLYVWGMVNNVVPYVIPRLLTRYLIKQYTFISSAKLLAGMGSFIIFYLAQTRLIWDFTGNKWVTGLYALSLIPTGNFALHYYRKAVNYRQHLVFLSLFYRRKNLIYGLIQQRMNLIESLNQARDEYLAATQQRDGVRPAR